MDNPLASKLSEVLDDARSRVTSSELRVISVASSFGRGVDITRFSDGKIMIDDHHHYQSILGNDDGWYPIGYYPHPGYSQLAEDYITDIRMSGTFETAVRKLDTDEESTCLTLVHLFGENPDVERHR